MGCKTYKILKWEDNFDGPLENFLVALDSLRVLLAFTKKFLFSFPFF